MRLQASRPDTSCSINLLDAKTKHVSFHRNFSRPRPSLCQGSPSKIPRPWCRESRTQTLCRRLKGVGGWTSPIPLAARLQSRGFQEARMLIMLQMGPTGILRQFLHASYTHLSASVDEKHGEGERQPPSSSSRIADWERFERESDVRRKCLYNWYLAIQNVQPTRPPINTPSPKEKKPPSNQSSHACRHGTCPPPPSSATPCAGPPDPW
jgi:hypothetical protein